MARQDAATPAPPDRPGSGVDDRTGRRLRFEQELRSVRQGRGSVGRERRWSVVGAGAMVVGAATAAVAFLVSLRQADTRDVVSMVILAVLGVCLTTAGAAVYLRHSLARVLRLVLLRLLSDDEHTL